MSNDIRYFIFSKAQLKERTEVEAKLGKKFYAGTVIVRGKSQRYTQLVTDLNDIRYTDYKIILQTDNINQVKYTRPYSQ